MSVSRPWGPFLSSVSDATAEGSSEAFACLPGRRSHKPRGKGGFLCSGCMTRSPEDSYTFTNTCVSRTLTLIFLLSHLRGEKQKPLKLSLLQLERSRKRVGGKYFGAEDTCEVTAPPGSLGAGGARRRFAAIPGTRSDSSDRGPSLRISTRTPLSELCTRVSALTSRHP